ncbi:MAG: tol-pal system protein YbgF [Candidatus Aminicenantes bacterium]|nr:tol-pal system protein YbgF [Candidatus Aminicenantes bacterium]
MCKRFIGIFLILLLALASAGADKKKKAYELIYEDVQLLRQQFLQLKDKIEKNSEDIDFIKEQLEELLKIVKHLQTEQASFKEDQKKIPTQYQIVLEKLETMTLQLIKFSEGLTEIKMASVPSSEQKEDDMEGKQDEPPAPEKTKEGKKEEAQPGKQAETEKKEDQTGKKPEEPPSAHLSPKEVYNMAFSDYRKGNFELAIDGFKMYMEQFPESPLADNSLYWIGECYFSQKKYAEAIEQFNELLLNYPRGDKVPAAYLKKGISLMELGKKEESLIVFKLLISKYPLEEETKIAQEKIRELSLENERYQQP